MTIQEACDFYNKATGNEVKEEDLGYHLESTRDAICGIFDAGNMVEKMGGKLTSRQTIAAIIACSSMIHKD